MSVNFVFSQKNEKTENVLCLQSLIFYRSKTSLALFIHAVLFSLLPNILYARRI